jgi:hypothetical protein
MNRFTRNRMILLLGKHRLVLRLPEAIQYLLARVQLED